MENTSLVRGQYWPLQAAPGGRAALSARKAKVGFVDTRSEELASQVYSTRGVKQLLEEAPREVGWGAGSSFQKRRVFEP